MKRVLQIARIVIIAVVLTAFTQLGGLIYLAYKPVGLKIQKLSSGPRKYLRYGVFIVFYLLATQLITPPLAKMLGRTPLPLSNCKLKPANSFIWLANRHYVKPELLDLLRETSRDLPEGMSIVYLDANFPFIDGFPLTGHISHNDGEKVDLTFIYTNSKGEFLNTGKSYSGYGVVEPPRDSETNQPEICAQQGFWHYSLPTKLTIERHKAYRFDSNANELLLKNLASDSRTGKVFIEPHLRDRLRLNRFSKVRFHGCHAVRHDDHIHLQL